jgi:prepilin-type N-terminal cleavage/methylation domain-containing protein
MKKLINKKGFTLIEILLSIVIIAISAIAILMWQKTSWSQTSYTNRLMIAGHVIEKQIERQRMIIAQDPTNNFNQFKNTDSMNIIDSTTKPIINVKWYIYDTLHDPSGALINNVCRVVLKASWGKGKKDTLKVETCIAKDF